MVKHWRYLCYVIRHKWYVFLAACRLGIPFLGLVHDLCKFSPAEWFAYAEFFHGSNAQPRGDGTGYCKPADTGNPAFEQAWLHHVHSTNHHWQHYAIPTESGLRLYRMPDRYQREMLADWQGASRANGNGDIWAWYLRNKGKIQLHPETLGWLVTMIAPKGEV